MKKKLLFLGSSIIEQWNTNICFPNSINLGISGLTSNDLVNNYYNINFNKLNINTILLYIGSNDVVKCNSNPYVVINNIIQFINILYLLNPFIDKIIYIAILKSPKRTKQQLIKIDIINKKIREFSESLPNLFFYNFNRELHAENLYQQDKTHLLPIGYSILCNKIKE